VAIILGAAALGWLLQRTILKEEKPKSGMEIFTEWQGRKLRGSAATLVGLVLALALYPLLSRSGIPELLGLSPKQLIFGITVVVGLLVMIAWHRHRNRDGE
jgi:high-affinity Fe2+/Pb2+ permease